MISIFLREFNGFLDSLIAYVVMSVFLISIGMLMWVFPETSVLEYGYADMTTLFSLAPYTFMFLIPAITMKSFAEEKKLGTMEWLLTKPLRVWSIIGGKFLASYALIACALMPSVVYVFSIYRLSTPVGNIDMGGIVTSYLGLLLLGGTFCAIGLFASAITSSQILAFVLGGFICMIGYVGFEMLSSLVIEGELALQIKQVGIVYHYDAMSRGLIDSRDMIYFFSIIGLMLGLTKIIIDSRK